MSELIYRYYASNADLLQLLLRFISIYSPNVQPVSFRPVGSYRLAQLIILACLLLRAYKARFSIPNNLSMITFQEDCRTSFRGRLEEEVHRVFHQEERRQEAYHLVSHHREAVLVVEHRQEERSWVLVGLEEVVPLDEVDP